MKEIAIIKEAIEKARSLARESEALAVSLEILISSRKMWIRTMRRIRLSLKKWPRLI